MIDLLASSYHDIDYIMETDYYDGLQLIAKARGRQTEDRQWQLYCGVYPHMNKDNFVSFENFFKKPVEKLSRRTKEQIRDDTSQLMKLFGKGKQ